MAAHQVARGSKQWAHQQTCGRTARESAPRRARSPSPSCTSEGGSHRRRCGGAGEGEVVWARDPRAEAPPPRPRLPCRAAARRIRAGRAVVCATACGGSGLRALALPSFERLCTPQARHQPPCPCASARPEVFSPHLVLAILCARSAASPRPHRAAQRRGVRARAAEHRRSRPARRTVGPPAIQTSATCVLLPQRSRALAWGP
eukprot:scaffold134903_cov32-Tisochrysis_lutea.AAC.1